MLSIILFILSVLAGIFGVLNLCLLHRPNQTRTFLFNVPNKIRNCSKVVLERVVDLFREK